MKLEGQTSVVTQPVSTHDYRELIVWLQMSLIHSSRNILVHQKSNMSPATIFSRSAFSNHLSSP